MDIRERLVRDSEIEIDLLEVLAVLIKSIWLIIGVGIFTALLGFILAEFVVPPYYESTTRIYILNKGENSAVTYSDVQMGAQLTGDYAQLIRSRYVMEEVIAMLSLDAQCDDLLSKVSVDTPTGTRIVSITVKDNDPVQAMNIANCVREVASEYIQDVMDLEAVNVAETANIPTDKAGPSAKKWALIGGVIGLFAICVGVFAGYITDDTIKTDEDIEKYLGLSTLALIPIVETDSTSKEKSKKKKQSGR